MAKRVDAGEAIDIYHDGVHVFTGLVTRADITYPAPGEIKPDAVLWLEKLSDDEKTTG